MKENKVTCIKDHVRHIYEASCTACEYTKETPMTPQLQNYINYSGACLNAALDALAKRDLDSVRNYILMGHVHLASGEQLDYLAEQCGVPARKGVPVPDAQVREAIIGELARHD